MEKLVNKNQFQINHASHLNILTRIFKEYSILKSRTYIFIYLKQKLVDLQYLYMSQTSHILTSKFTQTNIANLPVFQRFKICVRARRVNLIFLVKISYNDIREIKSKTIVCRME